VAIGQAGLVWASGLELGNSIAEIRIYDDAVRYLVLSPSLSIIILLTTVV
jgi:hypothetical protein